MCNGPATPAMQRCDWWRGRLAHLGTMGTIDTTDRALFDVALGRDVGGLVCPTCNTETTKRTGHGTWHAKYAMRRRGGFAGHGVDAGLCVCVCAVRVRVQCADCGRMGRCLSLAGIAATPSERPHGVDIHSLDTIWGWRGRTSQGGGWFAVPGPLPSAKTSPQVPEPRGSIEGSTAWRAAIACLISFFGPFTVHGSRFTNTRFQERDGVAHLRRSAQRNCPPQTGFPPSPFVMSY